MGDKSNDFKLSASLKGHDKDVRAVCFPTPGTVFTASRDCTVQAWHETASSPPTYSASLLAQGPYSFNSVAFVPPSESRPDYSAGLVLAGSHGHTIEVRKPDADVSEASVNLLAGHTSNVSAIGVAPSGDFFVSGDWDGRVKLWNTSTWEAELDLVGPDPSDKQRAIWAVLAYSNTIIITGSADHVIRGYSLQNKRDKEGELQPGVFIRTPDVVRALCRARKHPSGAQIASAGNDFLIHLWQFNGNKVGMLRGHESFIYALDCLPSGELVSSSEDRTVRIWKGESCIQTITHPALSIWSVSVCQKTGDFATGASDNIARIFTRSQERLSSSGTLAEFSESVQKSAIPQQQMGDVNPNTLPGPDFIETKTGTKEGQTVMINSGDGNISVYQWSAGQHQWLLVGTVVDSSAQEAENVETSPFFGSGPASSVDNFGSVDMHTTGSSEGNVSHAFGPHAVFVTLMQSNFAPVLNRITSINSKLAQSDSSSPELPLNSEEVAQLSPLVQALAKIASSMPTAIPAMVPAVDTQPFALETESIAPVLKMATAWPYKERLAGLDLLRCMAPSPSLAKFTNSKGQDVLDALLPSIMDFPRESGTGLPKDPKSVENNAMMALRLIANIFSSVPGQQLAARNGSRLVEFLSHTFDNTGRDSRGLMVAWTSAASNMASFALRELEATGHNSIGGESLLKMVKLLAVPILEITDAEVVYRALIALGNLACMPGSGDFVQEMRAAGTHTWVKVAIGKAEEARIKAVGEKILTLLES